MRTQQAREGTENAMLLICKKLINWGSNANPFKKRTINPFPSLQPKLQLMADQEYMPGFVDFLPSLAKRLGTDGLLEELCRGFYHLVDAELGLITLESLKRNSHRLGLGELGEEEAVGMLRMGDMNGDGVLDYSEFCMLMLRLSSEAI